MRFIVALVIVVVALRLLAMRFRWLPLVPKASAASKNLYPSLRESAFGWSREKIGLPPMPTPTEPWGVIMDWGIEKGTATVVAFLDGAASIYLSSGGGFIGGERHESVRKAAQKMVATAVELQPLSTQTSEHILPGKGQVNFYLLTDAGIFLATSSEETLRAHRDSSAKLWDASQELIARYRQAAKDFANAAATR